MELDFIITNYHEHELCVTSNHGCGIVNYNLLLDTERLRAWIITWITILIGDYVGMVMNPLIIWLNDRFEICALEYKPCNIDYLIKSCGSN